MRFILAASALIASASAQDSRDASCIAACQNTPACMNDPHAHSSYCKYWQNDPVCFGLYNTEVAGTYCFQPNDVTCNDTVLTPLTCSDANGATTALPAQPTTPEPTVTIGPIGTTGAYPATSAAPAEPTSAAATTVAPATSAAPVEPTSAAATTAAPATSAAPVEPTSAAATTVAPATSASPTIAITTESPTIEQLEGVDEEPYDEDEVFMNDDELFSEEGNAADEEEALNEEPIEEFDEEDSVAVPESEDDEILEEPVTTTNAGSEFTGKYCANLLGPYWLTVNFKDNDKMDLHISGLPKVTDVGVKKLQGNTLGLDCENPNVKEFLAKSPIPIACEMITFEYNSTDDSFSGSVGPFTAKATRQLCRE